MKLLLKKIILFPFHILDAIGSLYSFILSIIKPSLSFKWLNIQSKNISNKTMTVNHIHNGRDLKMVFSTPNDLCRYRATSFSDKEPETLDWIEKFGGEGALFDIGANVGLYSVYYALLNKGNVYSFEPSVLNLPLLMKNLNLNNVQNKTHIVSNPLTETTHFANFNLSTIEEGGAMSAFGVGYGFDGKKMLAKLSYKTLGFSLDYLLSSGMLSEQPTMIKIDVDGIEHLILRGAKKTLLNPLCKTVLVEVNDEFESQIKEVISIMEECGFVLQPKIGSGLIYNQIWIR